MAEQPSAETGTVMREDLRGYVVGAGFWRFHLLIP